MMKPDSQRDAGSSDIAYGIRPPAHRLPSTTHPGAVRLQVSDIGQSLEFYTRILGLVDIDTGAGTASLAAPESDRPLVELVELRGARAASARGHLGLYHFALLLPDRAALGRFLVHLRQHGVQPGMSDHLVSEALYLSDPDDLGIEVYADRPRHTWQVRAHELAMATDPLDVFSLVDAAARQPWDGAPPGTTLGHVHLHVGNLAQAEAFYHDALGLDKTVWSYPGALFLSAGGYHHHLGVNTWAATRTPAQPDDARLLHWELLIPVAAITPAAQQLQAHGYAAEPSPAGVHTADPWGTGLVLRPDKNEAEPLPRF